MSDTNVKIGISTNFDPSGTKKVSDGIDDVSKSVEEVSETVEDVSKAVEKASNSLLSFAEVFRKIGDEIKKVVAGIKQSVDNLIGSFNTLNQKAHGVGSIPVPNPTATTGSSSAPSQNTNGSPSNGSQSQPTNATNNLAQAKKRLAQNINNVNNATQTTIQKFQGLQMVVSLFSPQLGSFIALFHNLTDIIKSTRAAFKSLLANPYAFAIAALVGAFMSLKNGISKVREEAEKLFREGQDTILERIRDRNVEVAESFKKIANAVEDATDKMAHMKQINEMHLSNTRAIEDADMNLNKQKDLVKAVSPEEKLKLEQDHERKAFDIEWERKKNDAKNQIEYSHGDIKTLKQQLVGLIEKLDSKDKDIRDESLAGSRARREATNERKKFFGGNKDKIDAYEKEALEHDKKRNELISERKELEVEIKKNKREQLQAEERMEQLRNKFDSIDTLRDKAENAMKIAHKKQSDDLQFEKTKEKYAEQEAFLAQNERIKNDNEKIFDDQRRADTEFDWKSRFAKSDAAGKRAMLEERHDDALADEKSAKASIDKLTEAIKNETNAVKRGEMEKELADARGNYSSASGRRRSAEEALLGIVDDKPSIGGIKLNDRISALGGFSTAAAAAVSGGMGVKQKNPEIAKISDNVTKLTRQLEELNKKASFTATWGV